MTDKQTTPETSSPETPAPAKKTALKKRPVKAPEKATTKKATPKPKAAPKAPRRGKKGAVTTLAELKAAFTKHLLATGRSEGTARSYAADLRVAEKHFGNDHALAALTPAAVQGFLESDRVTLGRNGQPKNPITTSKIRRVFRMALEWAAEAGHLKAAPLPEAESAES